LQVELPVEPALQGLAQFASLYARMPVSGSRGAVHSNGRSRAASTAEGGNSDTNRLLSQTATGAVNRVT
jgi:hypothetical protein